MKTERLIHVTFKRQYHLDLFLILLLVHLMIFFGSFNPPYKTRGDYGKTKQEEVINVSFCVFWKLSLTWVSESMCVWLISGVSVIAGCPREGADWFLHGSQEFKGWILFSSCGLSSVLPDYQHCLIVYTLCFEYNYLKMLCWKWGGVSLSCCARVYPRPWS